MTTIQSGRPTHRSWTWAFLALFTLSGASGLILEVVWSRMLTTLLGVTTWGLLTILVTYMGGLGFGAIVLGRRASRSENPLRFYGRLELAIGLYALAVPAVFRGIAGIYVVAARWQEGISTGLGSDSFAWSVRLLAAGLALGLPTFLLGGTFPALARAVAQGGSWGGRGAALLYALNTAGAVVGCFLTGFVLIGNLGVVETNTLAGVIDVAIGLVAIRLSRKALPPAEEPRPSIGDAPAKRFRLEWLILIGATLSGFAGLAFEVLWTRGLLVALVDNTTYAFTMMLSTFLLGHAVGSGWIGSRGKAQPPEASIRSFGRVIVAAGFAGMLSLPILISAGDLVSRMAYGVGTTFWGRRIPVQMGLCLMVIGPGAAMLGGSFALSARLLIGGGTASAAQAGRLYGLNTLGAIVGAILTQVALIPLWGTQRTMLILSLTLVGFGTVVGLVRPKVAGKRPEVRISEGLAVTALGIVVAWGSTQFSLIDLYASRERMRTADAPAKLLGVIESPGAIVTVHDRGPDDRVINLNGTNVAGTNPVLRTIQTLQGELPLMLHPAPKSALQIGFGSGGTYATLSAARPAGMTIEVLELTPEVIAASERWLGDVNFGSLSASSDRVTINDARSHMASTSRTYDLILSDSIHPRFRGNASLYSKDYFELCAGRLNPGGLFSTWLPLYGISTDDLRGIFASLRSVFPHVQIWYPNAEPNENTILVGSKEPIRLDYRRFRTILAEGFSSDRPANRLRMVPERVFDFFLMGDAGVEAFSRAGLINTDDHPYLEFRAPRTLKRHESWAENFEALIAHRESPIPAIVGLEDEARARLSAWVRATGDKLAGQVQELNRNFRSAVDFYARAIEINPDDLDLKRRTSGLRRMLETSR